MKLNLENYKNIVESLNEGIIILNKNNKILYANKYILKILKMKSTDLLSLSFNSLFNKKSLQSIKDAIKLSAKNLDDIEIFDSENNKHFVNISFDNNFSLINPNFPPFTAVSDSL